MASRGAVAEDTTVTTFEYETVSTFPSGGEVVEGLGDKHTLPDYSHSPNSVYIKYDNRGFKALRVYGEDRKPIIEIAYHPEPNINGGRRGQGVWHFHLYNGLERGDAVRLSDHPEIIAKYGVYLEEVGYVIQK